jgi:DNA-binding transcriptional MerR regulator
LKVYGVGVSTSYKIAEVAKRSGFNPSTLRYYEELGLVNPVARTAAGYRLYDDAALERLGFIARAKGLGCSLDEISDLLVAWSGERCEPVQLRLRQLLETKIAEAQRQTAEMVSFTNQLQTTAVALGSHTPDGPCDDQCGCTGNSPIACTLSAEDVPERLTDWENVLAPVVAREQIDGGVRLLFPAKTPVGSLVELVAAEQKCCTFFRFAITVDERGLGLEVTAPDEAIDLVHSLFGSLS